MHQPSASLSGNNKQQFLFSRTLVLRLFFILSLMVAAVICGYVAYFVIQGLEGDVGEQTYESVAVSALEGAQAITIRKLQGANVMASIVSEAFPDRSMWPVVALDGYIKTASKVAQLSSSTSQAFIVLVRPDEASEFEAFAERVYKDHGYPETAGRSDFGFGIYGINASYSGYSDQRYHDVSGATSYGSKHSILAPIFQHNIVNARSLMFNVHSEVFRGTAIDSIIDCSMALNASSSAGPECCVVTDWVELIVRSGPAGLLYHPFYPANDPTKIVGIMATSIHWAEVLTNVVPDYVDGLYCVISTTTDTYTYVIHGGVPSLVGHGDLHDPNFSSYGRRVILNDIETNASASATYTLTVYPSSLMFDEFQTNSPIFVSLGLVTVIFACSLIFFIYDFFMKYESNQRRVVLEMKRRFVRFVSHEIRTPLNTVCMGLQLLEAELGDGIDKFSASYWLDLTGDILENSQNAVTVLNDLLNYDKIETGNFQLEIGGVCIWDLLQKTVGEFQIQARNKNIQLNLDLPLDDEGGSNGCHFNVVGDDMRLRQVIRNVVSNAMKFTSEDGTGMITITAERLPNGLPNAVPIKTNGNGKYSSESHPRAGSIRISAKDNGVGMSQDQLRLIFQEGIQFDPNKLQHGGGSGLGLCITKAIVEQHGGTIEVESDGFGQGTTFVIELPLYDFPLRTLENTETKTETASSSLSQTPATRKHHRILVVDDALMNRKMLVRLLERSGHTCVSVGNGQQAIDSFVADQAATQTGGAMHVAFDTILMDFEMPVMNGPEATKALRDMGCQATILGLTGNVLAEDVAFFKAHGANDVLPKPVKLALIEDYWLKLEEREN